MARRRLLPVALSQPADMIVPGGSETSGLGQAGDPAEAVERLRAVLRQHAERSGAEPEMAAPATEAQLAVGSPTPVDLAPLRALPALRSLDLSRCPTSDLALLADLPGLRYLALSAAQWTALIAAGRLPAHLAAARLAGAPSLTDALDLLAALGVDTSTAHHLSGTVEDAA